MADDGPNAIKGLRRLSLTPGVSLATHRYSQDITTTTLHDNTAQPTSSHGKRMAPKRMSTISYYTPSSPSTSSTIRSPPPPIILEGREGISRQADGIQRSISFTRRQFRERSQSNDDRNAVPVKDPPILTLADKHADLLTFIAQKESRCLELRDQLAQHEAELQSLKRKWERIVARSTSSTSLDHTSTSLPSSPEDSVHPLTTSKTECSGTMRSEGMVEVVGVIRDGVQGLGRMLMMGSLSTSANLPYPTKPSSEQSNNAVSTRDSPVFNSRTSSLSSSILTSPSSPSTGRESISSLTSTSSDAEEDKVKTDEFSPDTAEDAGHTPTPWMKNEELPSPDLSAVSRGSSEAQSGTMGSPSVGQNERTTTAAGGGGNGLRSREGHGLSRRLSQKTDSRLGSTSQSAASSSWVPINLNKKWEELQKIETFTKSSKRASVLLSDMTSVSTNLLGTLSSALSPSSAPSPYLKPQHLPQEQHQQQQQQQQRQQSPSPSSPMSPPYFPSVNKDSPTSSQGGTAPTTTTSTSILDEADEEVVHVDASGKPSSAAAGPRSLGTILVPTRAQKPPLGSASAPLEGTRAENDEDDDEAWNW